ncbi:MAG: C-GCAxxG-C-C family protein [Clostridia bacterium]|nr:C-GCAxxG-C-C family protein [Clostridia bacterium]
MTKGELAKQNFLSGLNCCQAVVLAFKNELGIPEQTLKKLSIGFGGGFARQRLTCGAVSGMGIVLSTLLSDGDNKGVIYAIIQEACFRFKKETGSIICGELLTGEMAKNTSPNPEERTAQYYKKRPCADLCLLAVNIAEEILKENGYYESCDNS